MINIFFKMFKLPALYAILLAISLCIIAPLSTDQYTFDIRFLIWFSTIYINSTVAKSCILLFQNFFYKLDKKLTLFFIATMLVPVILVILFLLRVIFNLDIQFSIFVVLQIWIMSQIITFLLTSIESSLISEIPKFSRQRKLLFVLGLIPLNLFFRNKKEILPEFINTAIENKSLGEFYALQQQGHYINIITSSKDELVLMKMKRANDLLKHSFGTQVHRSYWIRFMAIKEVVTKNSKTTIVLQNNTEIAVSKTYKIDFEKKYKIYQEKQARKEEI